MPDLTIEYYSACESVYSWNTIIGTHKVGFYNYRGDEKWECDCQGFKFRRKCKHIEEAKKKKCSWHQFTDGGNVVVKNGENCCPRCGGETRTEGWGV